MKPASEKRTRAWTETRFSNFQLANSGYTKNSDFRVRRSVAAPRRGGRHFSDSSAFRIFSAAATSAGSAKSVVTTVA